MREVGISDTGLVTTFQKRLGKWNQGSTMIEATTGERKDIFTIWRKLACAVPRCPANLLVCQ
jgi:hypothetical protein